MYTNRFIVIASLVVAGSCVAQSWAQQVITEDFTLHADDVFSAYGFGASIDISDGVIAVGSIGSSIEISKFEIQSGSAYLFDAVTGTQFAKLIPTDGQQLDQFGFSIAIDDGVVVVGSPFGDNFDDSSDGNGSAYLFNVSDGFMIGKFVPVSGSHEQFGHSVAIDDGIVVIGAPGSFNGTGGAYLFNMFSGQMLFELSADDGSNDDSFGYAVAINDGIVAVSAPQNSAWGGAVYLFDAITGGQITKVVPATVQEGDEFGRSIALDGGLLAVGAVGDSDNGFHSGAAYLFDVDTSAQVAKLKPQDAMGFDQFGISVALGNDTLVVGADWSNSSGAAYLFSVSTGEEFMNLMTNDIVWYDNFASSIAIENNTVCAGAPAIFGSVLEPAYVFTVPDAPLSLCVADLTGDGVVDFFDISAFLALFAENDPIADLTNDGIWDFFDVSAFLSAFAQGCP